jgi:radical SAM/Cys-rich protein
VANHYNFNAILEANGVSLKRKQIKTLQLNMGKLCNISCIHCHVNAGPNRKEIISSETISKIIKWFSSTDIQTLDLTGGTPEMVPDYQKLITEVRKFNVPRKIITRLNATIIEEPGYEWVANFLAENNIQIIASMPCYEPKNVENQRGGGVFNKSIRAFKKLNNLGYGINPHLPLHFVYNPSGDFLPPDQEKLEKKYKEEMKKHFSISFNSLFCITNMPISRFASWLKRNGKLNEYYSLLKDSFNSSTVDSLMCKDTINVNWLGEVFDCDFNQMVDLPTYRNNKNIKVWEIDLKEFKEYPIRTATHCFGCTAGAGSSCGGTLV